VTLNLDPAAAAAAVTEKTTAVVPVHIFGYPADMDAFEAMGLPIVEDAAQGLGARHAGGTAVGGRGNPSIFGFYPNKQLATGEGGMITLGDPDMKVMIDSERNQGRAPNMDWLDHDRLGFNYRLSDIACALGLAQMDRLQDMLEARARAAGWYREALADLARERGLGLPCEDGATKPGDERGWFVFVVQVPHDGPSRDDVIRALRDRGVQSKPYLPAIHLMSYYRKSFGYREGMFPVCEDVAARSLALPFFPELQQSQVQRVRDALADILA
jgi:perosamine synthetase